MRVEFGDEDDGTQYHSIYDDFYWYTHFVDTDFAYGRALSQTAGTAIMRLADADLIPSTTRLRPMRLRSTRRTSRSSSRTSRMSSPSGTLELQEGVFKATSIRAGPMLPPPAEPMPPFINFSPMKNAIALLKKSADRYLGGARGLRRQGRAGAAPQARWRSSTTDLLRVSRSFSIRTGFPTARGSRTRSMRPGAYTGYGAKPIAAVREYMDERRWRDAEAQVPQVAHAIESAARAIDKAAADLEGNWRCAAP